MLSRICRAAQNRDPSQGRVMTFLNWVRLVLFGLNKPKENNGPDYLNFQESLRLFHSELHIVTFDLFRYS